MADFTLTSVVKFPPGTSVGAYLANSAQPPVDRAPNTAAVNTQTMGTSSLTFTGLNQGVRYWAYAEVSGQHRYVTFIAGADVNPVEDWGAQSQDNTWLLRNTFAGTVDFSDAEIVRVTSEPLNIEDPTYGAVGDASTDNAAAFAAVEAALPVEGGEIVVPSGVYNTSVPPNFASTRSVRIRGQGGVTGGSTAASMILYTGTGDRAFDGRNSVGLSIADLELAYGSGSFTGTLLDLSGPSPGGDAKGFSIERVGLYSTGVSSCARLVDLSRAISGRLEACWFGNAVRAIRGQAGTGTDHYSNAIQVRGCHFADTITTMPIQDPGQAWIIDGNTFEGLASEAAAAVQDNLGVCAGAVITGNWTGDTNDTGTWITLGGAGCLVAGNYLTHAAVAVATGNSVFGTAVVGNHFSNCGTGGALGASNGGTVIQGNNFPATVTTAVSTGASPSGLTMTGNRVAGTTMLALGATPKKIVAWPNETTGVTNHVTYAGAMPATGMLPANTTDVMFAAGMVPLIATATETTAGWDTAFEAVTGVAPVNGAEAYNTTTEKRGIRRGGAWKITGAYTSI